MATLFEYYNTGDDAVYVLYGISWRAQTFTPATAHKITSVKLKLWRVGSPGTITVSIRATDGEGHPTGGDLCSGTIDGDTITTSSPGLWYEITLGAGYDLSADVKYAIVVRALTGSDGNDLRWRHDGSSPTYEKGCYEMSGNSGDTWTSVTIRDYMFEEWGIPALVTHELTVTDGIEVGEALVKNPILVLADGIALADVLIKNPIKVLVDGIALTDIWEGYKLIAKVLTDGIAFTDTLVKSTSKLVTDSIAFTDTLVKSTIKVITDSIAIGEALVKWWTQHYEEVFTDGFAIGEALVKLTDKTLTDSIAFTDTLIKQLEKVLTDGIAFTDVLIKLWVQRALRVLRAIRNLLSVREDDRKR